MFWQLVKITIFLFILGDKQFLFFSIHRDHVFLDCTLKFMPVNLVRNRCFLNIIQNLDHPLFIYN